jgi:uncharacterized protein (TIGR03437 family)
MTEYPLLFYLLTLAAGANVAFGGMPPDSDNFIVTVLATKPRLNSLGATSEGIFYYADAYGTYRVTKSEVSTLLSNQVDPLICLFPSVGCNAIYHPRPMAVDSKGTVYIADPEQQVMLRYDAGSGKFVTIATNIGSPSVVAVADDGSVYFNDPVRCRVQRLNGAVIETVAGTGKCGYSNDGGPATEAEILSVRGIALDRIGQLYIADDKAGVVRRVDTSGVIMTIAGTGRPGTGAGEHTLATQTPLNGPAALAIDAEGNLLIAESGANRVRMVDEEGFIRTIAGWGTAGHNRDYGLATFSELTSPACLAVSSEGDIYVCDTDRIRKLVPRASGRLTLPVLNPNGSGPHFTSLSWMTVLGDFDLPVTAWNSHSNADPFPPTSLAGVTAEIQGKPCYIAYTSPNQIDILLPDHLDITGWQKFDLTVQGSPYVLPILILEAAPAVLFSPQEHKDYVVARSEDGTRITPDHPVAAGQTIKFYATGLNVEGPIEPVPTSAITLVLDGGTHPLLQVAPSSPGIYELTAQLPDSLKDGDHGITIFAKGFLFIDAPVALPVAHPNQPWLAQH